MNQVEFLDQLFAARRELSRLIIDTAGTNVPSAALEGLMTRRDQLNVQIQTVIAADLQATMSQLGEACAAIGAATGELKKLSAVANDIQTAVSVAQKIVEVAGGVLSVV